MGRTALDTREFINRARQIHDGKYDYGQTVYRGYHKKVEIVCPEHGNFSQTPANHITGQGCPICRYKKIGDKQRINKEQLINRAREIHGDFYDYSQVIYDSYHKKIEIICPEHGSFSQTPAKHLSGQGCTTCGREKTLSSTRSNREEFISRAKEIHGDTYSYDRVEYISSAKKVEITCPEHGSFYQAPNKHLLSGQGCPTCRESQGEKTIAQFLDRLGICYQREYSFLDCLSHNGRPLKFDFCLFLDDTLALIEYDGEQHFYPIEAFGGEEGFRATQARDRLKTTYAAGQNIPLLRIPYHEEDPEALLARFLASIPPP